MALGSTATLEKAFSLIPAKARSIAFLSVKSGGTIEPCLFTSG